jgi:DNA-binding MarR family transcriptional regulator
MNLMHPLNCLTFNFLKTARKLGRGFEERVKAMGLTSPQFSTLSMLSGYGAQTVSQLAERLGTDRTTLTRNLDLLLAKGWITRVETEDQRQHSVELSVPGRERLNAAMPAWAEYQAELVALLGEDFAQEALSRMKKL